MSANPDDLKPPESDELTPTDEKKFGKFLDKWLAEDDAAPTGKQPAPTPTAPTPSAGAPVGDLSAAINAALDQRESKTKGDERIGNIEKQLVALSTPKKKKWFEPWTLFSG